MLYSTKGQQLKSDLTQQAANPEHANHWRWTHVTIRHTAPPACTVRGTCDDIWQAPPACTVRAHTI